jgi:hypothetical protein
LIRKYFQQAAMRKALDASSMKRQEMNINWQHEYSDGGIEKLKKILAVFMLAIFIIPALPCVSVVFAVNGQTSVSVVKAEQWTRRKPDLTLTSDDIVFSPASPTEGETVTITATIRNIGTADAWNVEVGFYDGPSLIAIKNAGLIKAGGTRTASIQWTDTPAGDHLIRVVADPNNKISESNEKNNEASKTITVSSVGVLIPDLTLTTVDIAFTPETPTEGDSVTIKATIHNFGNGSASDVKASFYYGSPATETLIGIDTVASIAAEGTGTASVVWTAVKGIHEIYVVVDPDNVIDETDESNNQASKTIEVAEAPPAPPYDYELFIEIDYIVGHEPTPQVLNYIEWYYMGNNPSGEIIKVTFYIDDPIPYSDAYAGVNDNEFWAIEAAYNDHDYGYYSKWKWVLYGTTVEGAPNVVGYTYVVIARVGWTYDLLAGNYIFIADGTADSWATKYGINAYGAEAVVLMHEMGHSIGIAVLSRLGAEVYDSDTYSVMSYLNVNNAGLYWAWYYSDKYWATRNMKYYAVAA